MTPVLLCFALHARDINLNFFQSKPLTVARLKSAKSKDVEDLVFSACFEILNKAKDEKKVFAKLPQGMRAVYTSMLLENEVNNGGFFQFFWNSSGIYAQEAVAGLQLLGAKKTEGLLKSAILTFKKDFPNGLDPSKRGDIPEYKLQENSSHLSRFDDAFYKGTDDLSKLRIRYIRAHPAECCPGA
ncbi:MAG: DMP19 family protein [Armatimonadetes bacterium]|nr:DMP19 family protein [Armatimonadota bacterium]